MTGRQEQSVGRRSARQVGKSTDTDQFFSRKDGWQNASLVTWYLLERPSLIRCVPKSYKCPTSNYPNVLLKSSPTSAVDGPRFQRQQEEAQSIVLPIKKGAQLFDDRRDKYHKGGQKKKEDESVHGTFETQVAGACCTKCIPTSLMQKINLHRLPNK